MSAAPARNASTVIAVAAIAAIAAAAAPRVAAQDGGDVVIYRCTGTDGEVVIGNLPCAEGDRQETRSMLRPVDGAPPPPTPPAAAPAPAPQPVVQYVAVQPPQPLYECVRPDGSTYESDSGLGEERWVPAWGAVWPGGGFHGRPPGHGRPANAGSRGATTRAPGGGLSAPPVSRISIPANPPRPDPAAAVGPRPRPPHGGTWHGGAGGVVERDPCHVLPRAEACARLRDRRDEIRTRFFNAQQRERDTLRVEERGLNARIDNDCRTY